MTVRRGHETPYGVLAVVHAVTVHFFYEFLKELIYWNIKELIILEISFQIGVLGLICDISSTQ